MRIFVVLLGLLFLILSTGCLQESNVPVACTLDAKVCPDGSAVGRIAPDCEFAPCEPLPNSQPPKDSEKTWVEIDPVQCRGNPWEQDWLETHGSDYSSYPDENESEVVKEYYGKRGITVYDASNELKYEIVCSACSCPRGDRLYLLISIDDVDKMVEWGYILSADMNAE